MVRRMFNGGYSVAVTYWIGGTIIALIFEGARIWIAHTYFNSPLNTDLTYLEKLELGVIVLYAIVVTLFLRALFISAYDERTPGFWGWIAILLTLPYVFLLWLMSAALMFPSLPRPLVMLHVEVASMNQMLPQFVEQDLILSRSLIAGTEMFYMFDVRYAADDNLVLQLENSLSLKNPEAQDVCREHEGYFRGDLTGITFNYSSNAGDIRARMSVEDCLDFLDYGLSQKA